MNNRKNYNSIVFLTVYLGLVLVGAAPQVLAHAATNSFFDIRNEIESKDDLDKKPDESSAGLKATAGLPDTEFIAKYVKLVSCSLNKCSVESAIEMLGSLQDANFRSLGRATAINFFQAESNKDGLLSKTNFNKTFETRKITPFALAFNQSQKLGRCKSQKLPEKVIYDSPRVASQNNQVFIVTRLPRGSIDSLLR